MKIRKHVTSRETCHQEILGIVPCGIAAKCRIRGCKYRWLSGSCNRVVALVGRVGLCALTLISGPRNLDLIVVLLHDPPFEVRGSDANNLPFGPESLTQILVAGIAEDGHDYGLLPFP